VCVSVVHNFLMANLKEQHICVKLCFRLGEEWIRNVQNVENSCQSQCHGKKALLSGFVTSNLGETSIADCEHSHHSCTHCTDKILEKVCRIISDGE
jgi:hypothetical protein